MWGKNICTLEMGYREARFLKGSAEKVIRLAVLVHLSIYAPVLGRQTALTSASRLE